MANPPWLRSITAVPWTCMACGAAGLTGECESGPDGDLCCPACYRPEKPETYIPVTIHYAPHEQGALADSDIHSQVLLRLHRRLITALVLRLGGKLDLPMTEVNATQQWLLGYNLEVTPITGDKITDATVGGVFHFETKKKQ